jgi:hypothetical protein
MNDKDLHDAVGKLPKSIDPPRDLWPDIEARINRRAFALRRRWYWIPLAAAALLAGVWLVRRQPPSWDYAVVSGRPIVGTKPVTGTGRLRLGETIQTDDSSRALIAVGRIGQVQVLPETRIQLVAARADEHRLALARGTIDAKVAAVPRLFFVDTPVGTAIDLGCAYTLHTDSLGNGLLHVTGGEVEFQTGQRSARVPLGALTQTRAGAGAGVPYVEDAPEPLIRALVAFDFANGGARATRTALAIARPNDALSLWHLLQRVDPTLRALVYDRLAALVPPPAGVSRAGAIALASRDLEGYWTKIHRIHFRRMILKGVKEIDPRTGTTVR